MGILDEDVARVREVTDIVALASEHIALKRVGRRFTGLCPFHSEKSPSFSINPEMGVYYCFGCQKSGDAITFVREIEHLDFVEAVERLAGHAGITLRYDDASFSVERKRKQRLHDAITEAIAYYHSLLLESADAGTGAALLAQPRLRRRRRAEVLARVCAGRLRRVEPPLAEQEVRARRTSSTPGSPS